MFHTRYGNWTTLEYNIDSSIHRTSFGPYKLREFPRRNNKTGGGGGEIGVKYGRLPGKTGVLTAMIDTSELDKGKDYSEDGEVC